MNSTRETDDTDAKGVTRADGDAGEDATSLTLENADNDDVNRKEATYVTRINISTGIKESTDAKMFTQCISATTEPATDVEEPDKVEVVYKPVLDVDSDSYDMTHGEIGHALIINQEQFSPALRNQGYSRRTGTSVDERNVSRRLRHLGFQVTSYPDLTGNQMKNVCKKIAAMDHSDCACFVCVILSHGEEGVVFGTDKPVAIKDLSDLFKPDQCPTLAGKPKLFIIQACRGHQTDPGVKVHVTPEHYMDETDGHAQTIKLPMEADFLFAYSTVPGFYSWRNSSNGSWFIQALCDVLEKLPDSDSVEIRKLLTVVNRKVAQNFQSFNPGNDDFHKMKQIPCITSMLTKDLFIRKKKRARHSTFPSCI